MTYSAGPKKRSRLQGHRKRKDVPVVFRALDSFMDSAVRTGLYTFTEYKIIRQYVNSFNAEENGHKWLVEDDPKKAK